MKILTNILFFSFMSVSIYSQGFIHAIKLDAGFISEETADLYLGKLQYNPQFQLANDKFRLGLNGGLLHSRKSINGIVGAHASLKIHNFSALNNNLSLGGLFLRTGIDFATSSEKIWTTGLELQFSHVSINVSYGRDFHLDNNWITYGFAIHFKKKAIDDDE